jgi:hypothetical protein
MNFIPLPNLSDIINTDNSTNKNGGIAVNGNMLKEVVAAVQSAIQQNGAVIQLPGVENISKNTTTKDDTKQKYNNYNIPDPISEKIEFVTASYLKSEPKILGEFNYQPLFKMFNNGAAAKSVPTNVGYYVNLQMQSSNAIIEDVNKFFSNNSINVATAKKDVKDRLTTLVGELQEFDSLYSQNATIFDEVKRSFQQSVANDDNISSFYLKFFDINSPINTKIWLSLCNICPLLFNGATFDQIKSSIETIDTAEGESDSVSPGDNIFSENYSDFSIFRGDEIKFSINNLISYINDFNLTYYQKKDTSLSGKSFQENFNATPFLATKGIIGYYDFLIRDLFYSKFLFKNSLQIKSTTSILGGKYQINTDRHLDDMYYHQSQIDNELGVDLVDILSSVGNMDLFERYFGKSFDIFDTAERLDSNIVPFTHAFNFIDASNNLILPFEEQTYLKSAGIMSIFSKNMFDLFEESIFEKSNLSADGTYSNLKLDYFNEKILKPTSKQHEKLFPRLDNNAFAATDGFIADRKLRCAMLIDNLPDEDKKFLYSSGNWTQRFEDSVKLKYNLSNNFVNFAKELNSKKLFNLDGNITPPEGVTDIEVNFIKAIVQLINEIIDEIKLNSSGGSLYGNASQLFHFIGLFLYFMRLSWELLNESLSNDSKNKGKSAKQIFEESNYPSYEEVRKASNQINSTIRIYNSMIGFIRFVQAKVDLLMASQKNVMESPKFSVKQFITESDTFFKKEDRFLTRSTLINSKNLLFNMITSFETAETIKKDVYPLDPYYMTEEIREKILNDKFLTDYTSLNDPFKIYEMSDINPKNTVRLFVLGIPKGVLKINHGNADTYFAVNTYKFNLNYPIKVYQFVNGVPAYIDVASGPEIPTYQAKNSFSFKFDNLLDTTTSPQDLRIKTNKTSMFLKHLIKSLTGFNFADHAFTNVDSAEFINRFESNLNYAQESIQKFVKNIPNTVSNPDYLQALILRPKKFEKVLAVAVTDYELQSQYSPDIQLIHMTDSNFSLDQFYFDIENSQETA